VVGLSACAILSGLFVGVLGRFAYPPDVLRGVNPPNPEMVELLGNGFQSLSYREASGSQPGIWMIGTHLSEADARKSLKGRIVPGLHGGHCEVHHLGEGVPGSPRDSAMEPTDLYLIEIGGTSR